MPELPEVQTITSDLQKHVVGFSIAKTWVATGYIKINDKQHFTDRVTGRKIVGIHRVAKNILIELDDQSYLHIHLAMTGQIFLLDPDQIKGKKAHVVFHIKQGDQNKILTFYDARMFGKLVHATPEDIQKLHEKYGMEPIAPEIDVKALYEQLKKKRTIIKNILMDQSLVAGLGNIYANEALFLAKLHPETPVNHIPFERFEKLMESAKNVLHQGIKNRGSTLPDKTYVDIWGKEGSQQNYFNVYLKENCAVCGSKIAYTRIQGRGTYFCPKCQELL